MTEPSAAERRGRVFSGMQPTNGLHLGNYLGALKHWVSLQQTHDCIYCVVDLHAMTVDHDPKALAALTRDVAAVWLAAGVDPDDSIVFVQSAVREHAELAWVLNCVARMGWLERMAQFKDKAGKHAERMSVGLFDYPVLQAADILLYKGTHVPVGEDQKQHLELARDIAQKFNNDYGVPGFFPLPEPLILGPGARVMSLRDGSKKMSKSDPSDMSRINLTDDAATILNKIRKATTDPHPLPEDEAGLAGRPEVENLVGIYAAMEGTSPADVLKRFGGRGFDVFKPALAELLASRLAPIAAETRRLNADPAAIDAVLKRGAERAREIAAPVMDEVRRIVGLWRVGPREAAAGDEPPQSVSARLQALDGIDSALEASAHPADMLDNDEFREAVRILSDRDVALDTVLQYAIGAQVGLSCAAFEALAHRADVADAHTRIASSFTALGLWQLHFALRALLAAAPTAPIGAALLRGQAWWPSRALVFPLFADYLRAARARGGDVDFGPGLDRVDAQDIERIEAILRGIDDPLARELEGALDAWRRRSINRKALCEFGRFVEASPDDVLHEIGAWAEPLALAEASLVAEPPRSVAIIGEPRAGKSSLVLLLAERLRQRGFAVFEAGAPEILAGQKYIGELEQRVQVLLRELATGKRGIWYAPDLAQLAVAGRYMGQYASILDQVLPAIAAGQLALVSEATPAQWTRLVQSQPALRGVMQLVRLPSLSAAEIETATTEFAAKLSGVAGIEIRPDVAATALRLARQYLGVTGAVGPVFDFLKLATMRALSVQRARLARDGLLETLSQMTGLPLAILDDGQRIELAELRRFFASRVIGQPAAVDTIVERIAMLKAGLTDPARPIGVFLFAGPTGTGKTELAKTLAEYLFGAPERMVRLDMSEFQRPESIGKIVGVPGETESESLAHRVRKQPFCVVLLDEFEKAHPDIWDLFLQVFDDGRLTDANGHTVDFRHAIVILTTNLGAPVNRSANVGFVPPSSSFTESQVMRAVQQNFRPEFVNRIDRIVVFQPLSRERMRDILHKELRRVLERRGLREREWAVEWEASAIEFLLDKGFTPDMGARPLRRAIDQYLLAPLAATLVEHRFPQGEQFLFVRSDGQAIRVEFVDPDADEVDATLPDAPVAAVGADERGAASLGRIVLASAGSAAERAQLQAWLAMARQALEGDEFAGIRTALHEEMHARDFWERDDRFVTLARYALHDRLHAALDTAASLEERLQRSDKGGSHSKTIAARLALQLYLIELGIGDVREGCVSDAVVGVVPVLDGNVERRDSAAWCARLVAMYRAWSHRRHMQLAELATASGPVLVIGGFGAWRLLSAEAGLHVLENDTPPAYRRAARVVVAADEPAAPMNPVRREQMLAARLAAAPVSNDVVRRYREGPSPLVRDARGGWRSGRLDAVLAGDFDLIGATAQD